MDASNAFVTARRGRWAVAAIFLVNGFLMGSWAPQIPVFLTRLGISEFTLGLLILLFGAGAVAAMAWCGYLLARFGSRPVVRTFSLIGSFSLLAVVLSPNLTLAAISMIAFGGLIGGMDVAMNANAVAVEKRLGRAIMSSSHGFWSLGGFAGGALGGVMIEGFGHASHAVLVTLAALAVVLVARPKLVADEPAATVQQKARFMLPRNPAIYLVGLIALYSMVPEGAVLDWSALYLSQELGADLATAGFAFGGFSAAMALMRFLGDDVRNRFGAVATLRVSSLIAAAGILLAGFSPFGWLAIAGFAFSGIGIANMVPIAFSAAGNQSGISSGAGLSVVTLMGYSGLLAAPSMIGFVGERTGFGPVFVALSALLVIVSAMAGLAASADSVRPAA